MTGQAKAERLAEALEARGFLGTTASDAAAELRRLQAVNQDLLEALKEVEPILARMYGPQAETLPPMQRVRAAIAKSKGQA